MKKLLLLLIFILSLPLGACTDPALKQEAFPVEDINTKIKSKAEKVLVGDVLTFEELIDKLAKDSKLSKEEARERVLANYLDEKDAEGLAKEEIIKKAANATFRIIGQRVAVSPEYKPTINFYCETSEGDYHLGIKKVLITDLNKTYQNISKGYIGDIFINLESPSRIYYSINGDFYDGEKAMKTYELSIGSLRSRFDVPSKHYKYCYYDNVIIIN